MTSKIRIAAGVVGMTVAFGCNASPSGGGSGETDGESEDDGDGDGDGDDDGDGDGDGDGEHTTGDGDGEGGQYCDVSQLPAIDPMWLEALPPWPLGTPLVSNMVMADDALFVAGKYAEAVDSSGFIARYDLDAEQQWLLSDPSFQYELATDGQHIYYNVTSGGLRRVSVDGIDEGWTVTFSAAFGLMAMAVGDGTDLLVVGLEETEPGDPPFSDAVTILYEKGAILLDSSYFGESRKDERATAVATISSGGYLTAIRQSGGSSVWIRSIAAEAPISADLLFQGEVFLRSLIERPDGFVMGGDVNPYNWRAWIGALDASGVELWRKPVEPCGPEVATRLGFVVSTSDRLWGTVWVESAADQFSFIIVQLDDEGDLLGAFRLGDLDPTSGLIAIASSGDAVAVAGHNPAEGGGYASWLARLQ